MRALNWLKRWAAAVAVAGVLAGGFVTTAQAFSNITLKRGIVQVLRDGVYVATADGELLMPSNAAGLLRAGLIVEGDLVVVQVVEDRGRHRGHVTVLK